MNCVSRVSGIHLAVLPPVGAVLFAIIKPQSGCHAIMAMRHFGALPLVASREGYLDCYGAVAAGR